MLDVDLAINSGMVVDGTGNPWYRASIGIKNGKIACLTRSEVRNARQMIKAQNLVGAYPVAVVELNEGLRIVAQMTDCKADELRIGLEVESTFRRIYEDDSMIRYGIKFRPARPLTST